MTPTINPNEDVFIPSDEDGHDKYLDQMDIEELHDIDNDDYFSYDE